MRLSLPAQTSGTVNSKDLLPRENTRNLPAPNVSISIKEGAVALKKIEVTEIKFASTDIRYRKQQGPVHSENKKKPL